ncbi:hypothetical protein [uncultured Sphingomonas sp.]|uniref:hypothetical protein n=1 Tax=uncultured Sphingomonas sp. TaxID=158754 RepID=UPI0025F1CFB7|nr:hypothetical protein [uncultured Sphingomonas sp.]
MRHWGLAALVALATATGVSARNLEVPANKGWMHAQTRLVVHSSVAGLSRIAITDATTSEHDIAVTLENPDKSVFATLFLFHPSVPSVPLWFDRSRTAIEERRIFEKGAPASADPIAFAPLDAGPAGALRQSYSLLSSPYRSTSLAVIPMGEWMLVVRLTAKTLTADALDGKMNEVIAALKPIVATTAAYPGPAVPIRPCAVQTDFAHLPKAKMEKPGGADVVGNLLMSAVMANYKPDPETHVVKPATALCRDGAAQTAYGVYRWDEPASDGYTIALYDAGRTVSVYPGIMSQIEKRKTMSYSVVLHHVDDSADSYPSFDGLPRPEQVFDLIAKGTPSARSQGKNVSINASALRGS